MSFLKLRCVPLSRSVLHHLRKSPTEHASRSYFRNRSAFSELSSAMHSVENYMKEMDREMNRIFRSSPIQLPRVFGPFDLSRAREIPVISTEGGRSYKLELDMQGMEPENINITLKDGELSITAQREDKQEDGSRSFKENTYHYTLPDGIKPETIRSSLSDGVLTIDAPLPALEAKEIPVKVEGGQKKLNSDSSTEGK